MSCSIHHGHRTTVYERDKSYIIFLQPLVTSVEMALKEEMM